MTLTTDKNLTFNDNQQVLHIDETVQQYEKLSYTILYLPVNCKTHFKYKFIPIHIYIDP